MCCCCERVGNMVVLLERKGAHGVRNLICVLGPYWPVMLFVTFPLIGLVAAGVGVLLLPKVHIAITVGFFILVAVTAISLGFTACRDPGILRRYAEKPEGSNWVYSNQARSFKPRGAIYCSDCGVVRASGDGGGGPGGGGGGVARTTTAATFASAKAEAGSPLASAPTSRSWCALGSGPSAG